MKRKISNRDKKDWQNFISNKEKLSNKDLYLSNNKIEKKIIKRMKKSSRIMVTAYNQSGSQTIDHYSLMGFTKAYNAAKQSCT